MKKISKTNSSMVEYYLSKDYLYNKDLNYYTSILHNKQDAEDLIQDGLMYYLMNSTPSQEIANNINLIRYSIRKQLASNYRKSKRRMEIAPMKDNDDDLKEDKNTNIPYHKEDYTTNIYISEHPELSDLEKEILFYAMYNNIDMTKDYNAEVQREFKLNKTEQKNIFKHIVSVIKEDIVWNLRLSIMPLMQRN